jgi:prepilin-type N-terminal cleavage/methylation domain-containing protein
MRRLRSRSGFTLMELVIVILIIGVIAAFGVPQYFKTVETTKADDASAMVAMAGTTGRMYALDHSTTYTSGTVDSSCNSGACGGTSAACEMVKCKYMAADNFDGKPYVLVMANASSNSSCGGKTYTLVGGGTATGNIVACVYRRSGASPGTNVPPYNAWGYAATTNGEILVTGSPPNPVSQ